YAAALAEGAARQANLLQLHEHARRFSAFSRQGLHRFLAFIDDLSASEDDLGAAPAMSGSADVARIMSIHAAKGLEFPVVFVLEAGRKFNFQDSRASILIDRTLGLGLDAVDVEKRIYYPTLPKRLVAEAALRESLAEELRVLYVALTRAKRRLVIVAT